MTNSATRIGWRQALTALLPGLVIFFTIYGFAPLLPQSLDWLPQSGDPVQAWLGWRFFADSPWSWPPGANPRIGLELDTSIVYTDSIPLLAFFFKLLAPVLSPDFQYAGLWLLICLVLQSYFGFRLCALYTTSASLRLLGACLFPLALPMLFRMHAHFTLCGHFIILAALCLCLEREESPLRHSLAWAALLCAAALIHGYFFIMASVLWGADLVARFLQKNISFVGACASFCLIIAAGAGACWLAGYFGIGAASSDGGFGFYRMNLLSLFDSDGFGSAIWPDLPSHPGEGEGFAYLGLGGLLVLGCAIVTVIRGRINLLALLRRRWTLACAALALTALAITHSVAIGPYEFTFPLPQKYIDRMQFFRASGRMFWPVFYMILLFSIAVVLKCWRKKAAVALLACALALQCLDVRALVKSEIAQAPSAFVASVKKGLPGPFWEKAGQKYAKIRSLPMRGQKRWHILASFALKHGMSMDCMYLARYNVEKLARREQETRERLLSGRLEPDCLYIIEDEEVFAAAKKHLPPGALAARIDDYNIVAPDWEAETQCVHDQTEGG